MRYRGNHAARVLIASLSPVLVLVLCQCSRSGQQLFGVYLLRHDRPTDQFLAAGLDELALEKRPVIAADDVVWYDRESHQMELTADARRRVQKLFDRALDVDGIPFVVCVADARIYRGAFWTPASSLTFDGITIMEPMPVQGRTVELGLGYPGPDAFTGSDPRSDLRILLALQAAAKLR